MEREGTKSVKIGGLEFVVMHRTAGNDGGASIEVYGDVEGKPLQVLRFDCFEKGPHFHYAPGDRSKNLQFHLDEKLRERAQDWAFEQIRDNIPEMLRIAGYWQLAYRVDRQALARDWAQIRDALAATKPVATVAA
jgi:hypothetical protein